MNVVKYPLHAIFPTPTQFHSPPSNHIARSSVMCRIKSNLCVYCVSAAFRYAYFKCDPWNKSPIKWIPVDKSSIKEYRKEYKKAPKCFDARTISDLPSSNGRLRNEIMSFVCATQILWRWLFTNSIPIRYFAWTIRNVVPIIISIEFCFQSFSDSLFLLLSCERPRICENMGRGWGLQIETLLFFGDSLHTKSEAHNIFNEYAIFINWKWLVI